MAVFGLTLENEELQEFAKTLKRRCVAGGSVQDGGILIQGDYQQTLSDFFIDNTPNVYYKLHHKV